jgi:peroxiredoxin
MRKTFLSLAVLALAASSALAADKSKFNSKVSVGEKAPTFAGIPATTPKGEEVSLSLGDMKEDVVVLVFLANHCPAVVGCEDRIQQLVDDFKGKSVKVVGVAVSGGGSRNSDNLDKIKERLKPNSAKKFNYVYGFDDSQAIGRDYGATATPTFFVLDKTRTIRYLGAMDDSTHSEKDVKKTYVKDAINALLDGKDVSVKETAAVGCGIQYDRK